MPCYESALIKCYICILFYNNKIFKNTLKDIKHDMILNNIEINQGLSSLAMSPYVNL